MSEDVTINLSGLNKLLKALKTSRPPTARIGILGSNASKAHLVGVSGPTKSRPKVSTNAEIGAAHEYGSPARNLPQRSFLRVPLTEKLNKYLEEQGAFDKEAMAQVIKTGSVFPWVQKASAVALTVVADAFDSAGFGKWAPWKRKGYENNTGMILVDTQQLRNSITDEVKEG